MDYGPMICNRMNGQRITICLCKHPHSSLSKPFSRTHFFYLVFYSWCSFLSSPLLLLTSYPTSVSTWRHQNVYNAIMTHNFGLFNLHPSILYLIPLARFCLTYLYWVALWTMWIAPLQSERVLKCGRQNQNPLARFCDLTMQQYHKQP